MKVTVYQDRNYYKQEENKSVDIPFKRVDYYELKKDLAILNGAKEKLIHGGVYKLSCTTDDGKYSWWHLTAPRLADRCDEDDLDLTLEIYGSNGLTTHKIEYSYEKKGFRLSWADCTSCNIIIESDDLALILALCLQNSGINKNVSVWEMNKEQSKRYNTFVGSLWNSYTTKMSTTEKYNVSADSVMMESLYSALKENFSNKSIEELTGMLEDAE